MRQSDAPFETDNPLVEIRDVSFSYRTGKSEMLALSSITKNLYQNEFACVLGPSGCGKSTLLKLLAGFEMPTRGEILVNGKRVTGPDWHRGVVFQQPNLFPWYTVFQNVAFGLKMRRLPKSEIREKTEAILETVGLSDFADKHVFELSGGMQQRVGIARTLINRPDLLLMDEPFSALDALTREQMQDFTRKLWWTTGTTIFFITHDVDEALSLGSRVLVLSKRPAKVIRDMSLHFSADVIQDISKKAKYSEEYFEKRELLLSDLHGPKEETG